MLRFLPSEEEEGGVDSGREEHSTHFILSRQHFPSGHFSSGHSNKDYLVIKAPTRNI